MTVTVGIRGAGLAGMSLAQALLAQDPSIQISSFDMRARLPHPGRTFCFFDNGVGNAPTIARHSWPRVAVRGNGFVREISVADTPYTMVRGDDYFASALKTLEAAGVSFTWGCRSVEVCTESSLVVDGHLKTFDVVVDAAFLVKDSKSLLWQSFAGEWVSADADIFDPGCAVLMDLGESSAESPISFVYILPTTARTALVEHTTFSVHPLAGEVHLSLCDEWLRKNLSGAISRGPREYGCIPMGLTTLTKGDCLSLGSSAGAIRPATGYAFQMIQNQASDMATWIIENKREGARKKRGAVSIPRWMIMGDLVFLRALARTPTMGTKLMEGLLSRAPSKDLVAFLSGRATFAEAFRVWSSVSKVSLLRALVGL